MSPHELSLWQLWHVKCLLVALSISAHLKKLHFSCLLGIDIVNLMVISARHRVLSKLQLTLIGRFFVRTYAILLHAVM
jgi:hypothetical protein